MKNREPIINELNELNSTLRTIPEAPYTLPENYFEHFPAQMLSLVKELEISAKEEIQHLSPLLAGLDKKSLYSVPDDYFSENLEALPYMVGEDQPSAILKLVEQVTPYEVPVQYFEELPGVIKNKIEKKSPVVRMRNNWMKIAVAAVVAGIIMVSGLIFLNDRNSRELTVAHQLKTIPTQEIDEFFRNTNVVTRTETAIQNGPASDVKSLLTDVDDKELEAFLKDVPLEEDLFSYN
ncbi:MAG: hypothetical protein H0U44_10935 [Flavisolibacter sp.]|jgi:hypothetical protein|nr:hypothetical protein [Flavisolibacter sp.]